MVIKETLKTQTIKSILKNNRKKWEGSADPHLFNLLRALGTAGLRARGAGVLLPRQPTSTVPFPGVLPHILFFFLGEPMLSETPEGTSYWYKMNVKRAPLTFLLIPLRSSEEGSNYLCDSTASQSWLGRDEEKW